MNIFQYPGLGTKEDPFRIPNGTVILIKETVRHYEEIYEKCQTEEQRARVRLKGREVMFNNWPQLFDNCYIKVI